MDNERLKSQKETTAEREERILKFWQDNKIFEKSLAKESPRGEFVFYEGPPTANGKPGIHHLEARAFKDVVLRYKTMRGYHVRRKGGWDTHGLPVELQVEKKLGLNSKKAIEEYGIAKFNQQCKESVWEYLEDWNKFTTRIGFWLDQKNPYVTYHNSYIESLWHVLKTVEKKGLLYKDYKVVPWCPRCGTALSAHEVAQGYQDDKDLSVYVKFKVKNEQNTYLLAWTTTPWTLPANVALAVGEDIEYVKIHLIKDYRISEGGAYPPVKETEYLILAESRLENVINDPYTIDKRFTGKELVGIEYESLYPFISERVIGEQKEALAKAYKVYGADFVTIEDGTGVVHTAVMYGQDDFELGTKIGLPKHHLVKLDGTFVAGTGYLESRFVKDEAVAVDIMKDLAERNLLFKKEKYEHSYPHCWRCQTPLLYYARDSWYIRVSSLRDTLVEENQSINWEPAYIRDGRFGEWLKEIKDWAISRERYWGTPLPIWITAKGKREVIGSLEELRARTKRSGNRYFVMRHGETDANDADRLDCDPSSNVHLTHAGKEQVRASARQLREHGIDLIAHSDFLRTRETAEVVAQELGLPPEAIRVDARLHETNFGAMNGKTVEAWRAFFKTPLERFATTPDGGETHRAMRIRMMSVLEDLERTYTGKRILIIGHGGPLWTLLRGYRGETEEAMAEDDLVHDYLGNADWREIEFVPYPHDEKYELDLHRPYIDHLDLRDPSGEPLTRVKEVLDVWFDSGAMPFAQDHYPFTTKEIAYPADFIAEAIDQTRGWFYTLHAVGIMMGRGKAYKNVICLGHILDAKGKKMSKSIGNIVDPWLMVDKYGVDTLRLWMYSVNQPGESKNFDEKTVAELQNKFFNPLCNVLAFYELYRGSPTGYKLQATSSSNILDQWILARLFQLTAYITKQMDTYRTLEPVRAMREFIDDLSTWYLRRSRERIKEGDEEALATLHFVLKTLAKLLAPFAPFAADDIWQRLRSETDEESVHLSGWPWNEARSSKLEVGIVEEMQRVREVASLALEARSHAGIKVRQPLQSLCLQATSYKLQADFVELIKDEVNVKEVLFVDNLENAVELDTTITPELKEEGDLRDLIRAVQNLRKENGLQAHDSIVLTLPEVHKSIIQKYERELKKGVKAERLLCTKKSKISIDVIL